MPDKYWVMVTIEVHAESIEEAEKQVMRDISSGVENESAYLVDSGECEEDE